MKMKNKLTCRRGEAYIDVVIGVFALLMVLVFSINVFEFLMIRQNLDDICDQLTQTAAYTGCFGAEYDERAAEMKDQFFDFDTEENAPEWYDRAAEKVQLGNKMTVTVTRVTTLSGMRGLQDPGHASCDTICTVSEILEGVIILCRRNDTKGFAYISACVFMLILMMFVSAIFMYSSAVSVVRMTRNNTKAVLDSYITANSIAIYGNIKQGNDLTDVIDNKAFNNDFISFCSLEKNGDVLISKDSDGNTQYSMTEPVLTFTAGSELDITVRFTIDIPIKFGGKTVTNARIPVTVKSSLDTAA